MMDNQMTQPVESDFRSVVSEFHEEGIATAETIATDVADPDGNGLRQILAAMMAFRDGNFSVRLPIDWSGTEGRIAEVFNQTITMSERMTGEMTRVSSTVGKEGRLTKKLCTSREINRTRTVPTSRAYH